MFGALKVFSTHSRAAVVTWECGLTSLFSSAYGCAAIKGYILLILSMMCRYFLCLWISSFLLTNSPFEAILPFQHWVDEEQERHESLKRKLEANQGTVGRSCSPSPPPCSFSSLITAWRGQPVPSRAFLTASSVSQAAELVLCNENQEPVHAATISNARISLWQKLSLLFGRFLSTRQLEYNQTTKYRLPSGLDLKANHMAFALSLTDKFFSSSLGFPVLLVPGVQISNSGIDYAQNTLPGNGAIWSSLKEKESTLITLCPNQR